MSRLLSLYYVAVAAVAAVGQEQGFAGLQFLSSFFNGEEDVSTKKTRLSLIGAGFCRTGTKSTQVALESLGYKVYDTRTIMTLQRGDDWVEATRQAKEKQDFTVLDALVEEMEELGYNATLDFPMNVLAPYLSQRRPDAKVLMTLRQSDEAWVNSVNRVNKAFEQIVMRPFSWLLDMSFPGKILHILYGLDVQDPLRYPEELWRPVPWLELPLGEPHCCDTATRRQQWVDMQSTLRRECETLLGPSSTEGRLLVYGVHEGWAPLLQFLGLEEMSKTEPFPHVNDGDTLALIRPVLQVVGAILPLLLCLPLLLLWAVWRCCCGYCRRQAKTKTL